MEYVCDFSVKLFKHARIFEHHINDKWIMFAPDWPGFPIVITDRSHDILNSFIDGAIVSDVLNKIQFSEGVKYDFESAMSAIAVLEERGFLRTSPFGLPYSISSSISELKPQSISIWLHINNDCNLACSYCFVKNKSKTTMKPETFENVACLIAKTARTNHIKTVELKFAGGEPTLDIQLMENFRNYLLEQLNGIGIEVKTTILSNGTILNDKLISFLKMPNTGIGISLDGFGASHDKIRKFKNSDKGSWEIILKNIETLRKNDIYPGIMVTLSLDTCESMPQLVKWTNDNKLHMRLGIVREFNCGQINSNGVYDFEYNILNKKMIETFESTFLELEDPSIDANLCCPFEINELHFNIPSNGVSCGIGNSHIVIKSNGNLVGCPMLIDEEGINPSDDLLASCAECFKYKPSERKYDTIEDDCLFCLWFPVCAGGCSIMNLNINGHPFTKSPMCEFYKYVIPRYILYYGIKLIQSIEKSCALEH